MRWSRYGLALGLALTIGPIAGAAPPANSTAAPTRAPSAAAGGVLSASDIYKQALPSVVYIDVQAKDGNEYAGSGFVALKDGDVVTCWHVVHDAKSATVRFSDGEEFEATGLVDHDLKNDVALIKIKTTGKPLLPMSKDDPQIGANIYTIGSPLGLLDFTISNGIISQIRTGSDGNVYQFTAPVSHGNSGGPVLDSTGHVIGLVDSGMVEGQNLNFAAPAKYAMNLDPTLPTVPWSSVVDDTPSDEQDTDVQGDKAVEKGYVDFRNSINYLLFVINRGHEATYMRSGVPPQLYSYQGMLKSDISTLSSITSDDSAHDQIRTDILAAMNNIDDAIDYASKAILIAQTNGGNWSGGPSDLLNRAFGSIIEADDLSADDSKTLLSLPNFTSDYPDLASNLQDKNGFYTIGIATQSTDPLWICVVRTDSISERIGLRPGDRVVTIDGQAPANLADIVTFIKKDFGKTIDIVLMRGDKQVEIKKQVPAPAAPSP